MLILSHNLPLFLLFADYEKAYDHVNRDKLWEMTYNKFPKYLPNTSKCIYRNTTVKDGISEPSIILYIYTYILTF